jgi:hypothetical protein
LLPADRKSGIRARRSREAKRLNRDRKIYRLLRRLRLTSEMFHRLYREDIEPLSVYAGKPNGSPDKRLTVFPVRKQPNGLPMPHWNDLSAWMKVQLAVMAMNNWRVQTFNIHIHSDLEHDWVATGRDPRKMMRDRLRKEFDRLVYPRLDWFFIIEGWSSKSSAETFLHIHGAAASFETGDDVKIMNAAGRAAGHGIKGFEDMPRAVHGRTFTRERAGYANYLFKASKRRDDRLAERRLTMSRSMVGGARDFWNLITDQ